jgi:CheY-like chemotaxis protein
LFSLKNYLIHPKIIGMPKVLIVDDEEINRLLLKTFLIKSDFEVVLAEDGEEAVDILDQIDDFDFVLTDIMMPKMNGIELLDYIRNHSNYSKIPVVAVSAGNPEFWLNKTIHNFNKFFSKPISRVELIDFFLENKK